MIVPPHLFKVSEAAALISSQNTRSDLLFGQVPTTVKYGAGPSGSIRGKGELVQHTRIHMRKPAENDPVGAILIENIVDCLGDFLMQVGKSVPGTRGFERL